MRRERDEIRSQLTRMCAECDELEIELEIIRHTKGLVGKGEGADPDNLTNRERSRLVLHLAGRFDMMPRDLLGRCGFSRSTFHNDRKRLGRPGKDEWLFEPVMAAFNQSHERYGFRRIWRMLRDQGIRVCARRVMKLMTEHGIVPKLRGRRRYSSYSGEYVFGQLGFRIVVTNFPHLWRCCSAVWSASGRGMGSLVMSACWLR